MTEANIPTGFYARILTSTSDRGAVFVFDSGREVDHFNIPAQYANDLDEIQVGAKMFGWTFLGIPEPQKEGQLFVRVKRSQA